MWGFIKGFFGSSGVMDTANDAIRKLGGLDDINSKERVDAFISVVKETKHQSPARRFIAILVTLVWAMLIMVWTLTTYLGEVSTADSIKVFMGEVVREPFNFIIGFYFVSHILSGIKK